jgi:hypothetical protein
MSWIINKYVNVISFHINIYIFCDSRQFSLLAFNLSYETEWLFYSVLISAVWRILTGLSKSYRYVSLLLYKLNVDYENKNVLLNPFVVSYSIT